MTLRPDGIMVPISPLTLRSLYFKAVIPIVALVLLGIGGVSLLAMRVMGDGVRLIAEQRARYGLAYIRHSVEDARHRIMTDRGEALQEALARLGLSPDTDTVRILSGSGKVLYSSRPAEVGRIMQVHLPVVPASTGSQDPPTAGIFRGLDTLTVLTGQPDVLHAVGRLETPKCAPCHARSEGALAFADVDISLTRQSAGMRTWSEMATAAAVAQFAIIGLGTVLILALAVVRPLRRLSGSMGEVQHGNLEVRAVPPGTTEIDELVTGFNEMVRRLQRARQVEQDAQRSHLARVEQLATLGEVAASLAHEIRNPLAGAKAAIDVLAGEEKAEESGRILHAVSKELARVDGVVRQLTKFARPKAPVLAKVDLRAVLDGAVLLTGPRAFAQGAVIEVQGPKEPMNVRADADMVQQVVVNLLINALQAMEGVRDATLVLTTSMRDGQAACSARDNGPGVPEGRADAIFRPFMTTKDQGTGLGLATSRRIVELHGGRLWLENPGERGACFTFTLPLFTRPEAIGA